MRGGMVAEKRAVCRSAGSGCRIDLDVLDEAHVEHLVRLVEHHDADGVEVERAAPHVVHDAARACRRRRGRRGAARGAGARSAGRRRPAARATPRYLAAACGSPRRPGSPARASGASTSACDVRPRRIEPLEHRQGERRRLARAGLRLRDQVPARQQHGNRLRLDGRRRLVARPRRTPRITAAPRPRSSKLSTCSATIFHTRTDDDRTYELCHYRRSYCLPGSVPPAPRPASRRISSQLCSSDAMEKCGKEIAFVSVI